MRHFYILFIFISTNFYGQTTINNVTLDTTGLLHWDISSKLDHDATFGIQKYIGGNWVTISQAGIACCDELILPGQPKPEPEIFNYKDSRIVPLDKGENKFRLLLLNLPSSLISNEISISKHIANINKLIATGDFISLNEFTDYCYILDSNGKQVKSINRGNFINISDLKKGLYYINFNRKIYTYEKK